MNLFFLVTIVILLGIHLSVGEISFTVIYGHGKNKLRPEVSKWFISWVGEEGKGGGSVEAKQY